MKISTKTGDKGESGLFNGRRLSKSHQVFGALGDLDELNSYLGLCAVGAPSDGRFLRKVQKHIYRMMSVVGYFGEAPKNIQHIGDSDIYFLEEEVDRLETKVGDLSKFVQPGTTEDAARMHVARCICRRAERALVQLSESADLPEEIIRYVNRLSDVLYLMACDLESDLLVHSGD